VRELTSIALDLGKGVEGHSAGATGRKLQAYTDFGVSSCHEPITEDEVLERLRLGYWVMIREGAVRKELPGVKGIFGKKIDFRRLMLVTDGMDPEAFMEEGYLDASLKRALELGVPPEIAYQMVTINAAEHFHLDHLIGSLSSGKMADIVMIPSPKEFLPQLIMSAGQILYKDGRNTVNPRKVIFPDFMFHTVKVQDFKFPSIPRKGKVRAIELVTDLVTKERIVDLEDPEESKDLLMLLAIDRVGTGGAFMGLLKGFGLQKGAYGSTTCWDTIDMIVVGCDTQSMEMVIGRLKEIGGGGVYAIEDKIIEESPAPIWGVYSKNPMAILREEVKKIEDSMKRSGVRWQKPVLTIDVLTTPAIPHLRMTHHGYVRLRDRKVLPLVVV
jgi:adenine deaminase